MKAETDRVVTIEYTVAGEDGGTIDASADGEPLPYLHGHGNLVAGLERVIEAKSAGDSLEVTVDPADGYGERDERGVIFGSLKKVSWAASLVSEGGGSKASVSPSRR